MPLLLTPYNPDWPHRFEHEASRLRQIFGPVSLAMYHVGSTSILGMWAKPIIDIVVVVDAIHDVSPFLPALAKEGYDSKGENGIPFRHYLKKSINEEWGVHVHIYEKKNHVDIDRHLLFREFLRTHPEEAEQYSQLKQQLAATCSDTLAYINGKEPLIQKLYQKIGFSGTRFVQVLTTLEWQAYHRIVKASIFDHSQHTYNFHHPSVTDPNYTRLIWIDGVTYVGVIALESTSIDTLILRIIAIDNSFRNQGIGSRFLTQVEEWLRHHHKEAVYLHANPKAVPFYKRLGYTEMPFPIEDTSLFPDTISMGKRLV